MTSAAPSLTLQLAGLLRRPIDDRTRRRAVLHWIDWMGCVAAGARSPAAQALRAWRPEGEGLAPLAHPALIGRAQSAWQAVCLDAGPANVEEMDDMHRQAILHPGPVVIPALAQLARTRGLRASVVLDALVRGYDAMIRIGRTVGARHYFHWHNTATAGSFGAAAACADALSLSDQQTVWALGNAGTQAAGLWQVRLEPVMSKQLHVAHAAWSGLQSATLAQAGFTGPAFILEGERGFFAAMCDGGRPQEVLRDEADWLIHATSFKPWPACRHTHPTIDAVLALRERFGHQPLAIASAEVQTFADAIAICDNPRPRTRTEAKFSLQYAVAAAARFGPLAPGDFDAAGYESPELLAAAARVRLVQAPDLQARYPDHYGSRVRLRLDDGREAEVEMADALGDPERPLPTARVFDKARELMAWGGVPADRAARALDQARRLFEGDDDIETLAFPRDLLDPLIEDAP